MYIHVYVCGDEVCVQGHICMDMYTAVKCACGGHKCIMYVYVHSSECVCTSTYMHEYIK